MNNLCGLYYNDSYLWVCNFNSLVISKIFIKNHIITGNKPLSILNNGTHFFVANGENNTIYKIDNALSEKLIIYNIVDSVGISQNLINGFGISGNYIFFIGTTLDISPLCILYMINTSNINYTQIEFYNGYSILYGCVCNSNYVWVTECIDYETDATYNLV